jgi:DNA-damage-inducible protein D
MQLKLLHKSLDELRQIDEFGNEFWYARDLWEPLGYTSWRNFKEGALERARDSSLTSGEDPKVAIEVLGQLHKKKKKNK